MSLTRWSTLRSQGFEVAVQVGAFYLDPAIKDLRLVDATARAVEKYCVHYEKLGWLLESRPKVTLVPVAVPSEAEVRPDKGGKAVLLVPIQPRGTMPASSPFNRPGQNRYVVRAVWTHAPLPTKVEVPDDMLKRWMEKGTMPKGLRIL